MYSVDQLIAECCAVFAQDKSHRAVREVIAQAVSDPRALMIGIGEPRRAGLDLLYRSPEFTILNVIWGPGMTIMPHNHNMWAVIGLYTGREDNIFWRRLPTQRNGEGIEAAGARSIGERQAATLGPDVIHSVTNPTSRLTGAIHVYGGDFVAAERSEWDPDTLREEPYDMQKVKDAFERSNRSLS
jgi:predicted metal-dependent enzyme (double-stranded beta helix superfamily)